MPSLHVVAASVMVRMALLCCWGVRMACLQYRKPKGSCFGEIRPVPEVKWCQDPYRVAKLLAGLADHIQQEWGVCSLSKPKLKIKDGDTDEGE